MNDVSQMGADELRTLVADLNGRLSRLEERVDRLQAEQEPPEDVVIAISAAVSAFLGNKAKVRAVQFHPTNWGQATRNRVHDRRVPHVR